MDSLASHIATICVTLVSAYLLRFLEPTVKILYWNSHNFLYTIPANQLNPQQNLPQNVAQPTLQPAPGRMPMPPAAPPPFLLLTNSLTIQNLGRKPADWVEVVHRRRPDFFQFYPPLDYEEDTTPAGEHVLRITSVAPKECFTIQFLSHQRPPEFLYIRSTAGHASFIPVMPVRQYAPWVYEIMRVLILIGGGFCVFWLVKGAVFVLKAVGAL